MPKTYVLYHSPCLDGFGAAYAAWLKFGDGAEYIGVKYSESPPEVEPGSHIYILDFSYPLDVLMEMFDGAASLLVLDHHKSARDDLADLPFARFDMERSGCALAWECFHPDKEFPDLLAYIQDRDLWRFELSDTDAVCAALWHEPQEFEHWSFLARDYFHLTLNGRAMLKQRDSYVSQQAKNAFAATVDEFRALFVNATVAPSELCHHLLEENESCEIAVAFRLKADGRWRWEFRSRKEGPDVSLLAKKFGGGGHPSAAGAITEHVIYQRLAREPISGQLTYKKRSK